MNIFVARGAHLRAEACKATASGMSFIEHYLRLASQSIALSECCWKVTPKLHCLCHIVHNLQQGDASRQALNPNLMSCWGDETFMGKIAHLVSKTHRRTASSRTLSRYNFCIVKLLLETRREGVDQQVA